MYTQGDRKNKLQKITSKIEYIQIRITKIEKKRSVVKQSWQGCYPVHRGILGITGNGFHTLENHFTQHKASEQLHHLTW